MKNFKRILALVMVFCTVAAWMIPGVSATDAVVTDYDFYATRQALSLGTGWCYIQSNANWQTLAQAYAGTHPDGKTSTWMLDTTSAMQGKFGTGITPAGGSKTYPLYFQTSYNADHGQQSRKTGMAFRVKAPATGKFTLNVSYMQGNDAALFRDGGAYVWEAPASDYTAGSYAAGSNNTILANESSLYHITNKGDLCSGDPVVAFKPYDGNVSGYLKQTAVGGTVFEMTEGKEYLVFVYGINDADTCAANAASSTNAIMYLNGFSLVPYVEHDYSITYYANYVDADPATVADNENATSTAASVDFTVDEVPFTREGSWAISGWATTADGDVVYKTGDIITLTSEDPSIELYAVWKEVWDPANNTDLYVNFQNDFTAAGVVDGGYLVVYTDKATNTVIDNPAKLDVAYAAGTIKWTTLRCTQTNEMSYNATSNGGRFRASKYLEVSNGSQQANYPYAGVPLKFKAPGTGEYKLSFTYGNASSSENRGTLIGAYIQNMPESGSISRYTSFSPYNSHVLLYAAEENPAFAGSATSDGTVMLEGGEEYVIVFFTYDSNGVSAFGDFVDFTLTEVKPEAFIGSTEFETVEDAIDAAVSGNTIKLNIDATATDVNLPAGVTLNLNGKTLTATAFTGILADSTDGTGRLAVAKDLAVVNTTADQIPLWDNTTGVEGYRAYNYTFSNYQKGIFEGTNAAVTAINKNIHFYDFEADYLDTKDSKFRVVAPQIKEAYDNGDIDWRMEMGTAAYQFRMPGDIEGNNAYGGNGFASGPKSFYYFGGGWVAIRLRSPGEGNIVTTLTVPKENAAIFDAYIVKASVIENALGEKYEEYSAALTENLCQGNGATTIFQEYKAAIDAAIANETAIIKVNETGVAKSFSGEFEYEAGIEYVMVLKVPTGAPKLYLNDLTFTRAAKEETMAQSVWSVLEFTNAKAYTLIASEQNDLQVGFDMAWNGVKKTFALSADQVVAWAKAEEQNVDTTYGFYVRIEGFEKVGAGTLTGTPYIAYGNTTVKANTVSYTYNAE